MRGLSLDRETSPAYQKETEKACERNSQKSLIPTKEDAFIKSLTAKYRHPAFVDEVGLGAIFAEHVACAVQIFGNFRDDRVNDSKQMKHGELYRVAEDLVNSRHPTSFLAYGLGVVEVGELLELRNMHKANRLAMCRAIEALPVRPDAVFIDGKFTLPESGIETYSVIKGDAKVFGVAAASVIAKNYRDHLIRQKYPQLHEKYDILNNVGYRSPRHLIGIRKYGITLYHRPWLKQIQQVLSGSYDEIILRKYSHIWNEYDFSKRRTELL